MAELPFQISIPFLAIQPVQYQALAELSLQRVEGVIFNRQDLDQATWKAVWQLLKQAVADYGEGHVVFHFPVNDCNYVNDTFVRQRLKQAYVNCNELGLAGMVVHANRIRPLDDWDKVSLIDERHRVLECLASLEGLLPGNQTQRPWIGLENMPLMDNYGIEIDPVFAYPNDFRLLDEYPGIGITWDLCHYTNTLSNLAAVNSGKQSMRGYPNIQAADYLDFLAIEESIVHWHFSGFQGIANPATGSICKEGVAPALSTLGGECYAWLLRNIANLPSRGRAMTLEIQEDNYLERTNFKAAHLWINQVLGTPSFQDSFSHRLSGKDHNVS